MSQRNKLKNIEKKKRNKIECGGEGGKGVVEKRNKKIEKLK